MKRFFGAAKVLAFNALLVLVGAVIIELIWGSWFSDIHPLYQFTRPRYVSIVQQNPLGDEPKTIRYTRDKYGFRGSEGPLDKVDIITVGGSTTDQRYVDDALTYQAVLKELFAANGRHLSIVNAGIDGQSTIGHIYNFSSWFSNVDGLRTRYILFYVGINDILNFQQNDTFDPVLMEGLPVDWRTHVRERSVFNQLRRVARSYFDPPPFAHVRNDTYMAIGPGLVDQPMRKSYDIPTFVDFLGELKARISRIGELTSRMGAKSIFVTQRSSRWDIVDGRLVGTKTLSESGQRHLSVFGPLSGVDTFYIERAVADAIMEQCLADKAICVDLAKDIKFDLRRDFYDTAHTTAAGSRLIGEYLYKALAGKI